MSNLKTLNEILNTVKTKLFTSCEILQRDEIEQNNNKKNKQTNKQQRSKEIGQWLIYISISSKSKGWTTSLIVIPSFLCPENLLCS